jgi:hypothetical protein
MVISLYRDNRREDTLKHEQLQKELTPIESEYPSMCTIDAADLQSPRARAAHRNMPCQFGRGVSIVFYRGMTFVTAQGLPPLGTRRQPKEWFYLQDILDEF